MTCTCWPRCSGGSHREPPQLVARGITYSFEMQPVAMGAKKARVIRLTAARTAPPLFEVSCQRPPAAGRARPHVSPLRPVPPLPRACRVLRSLVKDRPVPADLWALVIPKEGFDDGYWEEGARGGCPVTVRFGPRLRRRRDEGDHQIWFMGSVYDGAMGSIVTTTQITLTSGTTTLKGKVDATPAATRWDRCRRGTTTRSRSRPRIIGLSFRTTPASRRPTPPPASQASDVYSANTTQTFDFDAYLFPEGLEAPR